MTQDYKKKILEYVLGKVNITEKTDEEIFEEIIESPSWASIEGILPSNYNGLVYTGMVAANEKNSSISVLYGYYTRTVSSEDVYYGIITLVDENFTPIKSFFETTTGTTLRPIYCMEQDSDNTFYAVDKEHGADAACRLVMFNNFTIKNDTTDDYELRMRKTYAFGSDYRDFRCTKMFKNPDTAHYIFFGNYYSNRNYTTRIVQLKINVGSTNEWSQYTNESRHFVDAIATFNSEDQVRYRAIVDGITDKTVYSLGKSYTGTTPTSTTIYTFSGNCDITLLEEYCSFINYNKVYFSTHNQFLAPGTGNYSRFIGLYCYDYSSSELSTIYYKNLGNLPMTVTEEIFLSKNQGELYIEFNNNFNSDKTRCDYYLQRLTDDTWYPKLVASSKPYALSYRRLYVKNNFNLLQVYFYTSYIPSTNISNIWFQCVVKENYNSANYNGNSYDDYNSLIPQQATIYSNNSLVFTRNLYNLTINDNQINATVVVPNTYLNGINIDTKKLLSETNTDIVVDNNSITTNIYETLYLNFINTITVYDTNDETYKQNLSNYIVKNINIGTQQNNEDTFIAKLRIMYIRYHGGSSGTIYHNLNWEKIDDTHYQTEIAIKIDQNDIVKKIDIISADNTEVYVSLPVLTPNDKYYLIKQKIRIE